MTLIDGLCVGFGILGFLWGARFYLELRKWAYLIKYGRIVVAYKNKVKLNAPIQEWALWCKMAEQDKSSNGRVVYTLGGTRIAVMRKSFVPDPPVIRAYKTAKKYAVGKFRAGTVRTANGPTVREGTWEAEDQTPKGSTVNG